MATFCYQSKRNNFYSCQMNAFETISLNCIYKRKQIFDSENHIHTVLFHVDHSRLRRELTIISTVWRGYISGVRGETVFIAYSLWQCLSEFGLRQPELLALIFTWKFSIHNLPALPLLSINSSSPSVYRSVTRNSQNTIISIQ